MSKAAKDPSDYRTLLARYVGETGKSGLSANEVGRRIGITGKRVMDYVKGRDSTGRETKVTTARLVQLADAMNITNDELRSAGRPDAAEEREGRTDPPRGGPLLPRMLKLRDELNALIADARERGL